MDAAPLPEPQRLLALRPDPAIARVDLGAYEVRRGDAAEPDANFAESPVAGLFRAIELAIRTAEQDGVEAVVWPERAATRERRRRAGKPPWMARYTPEAAANLTPDDRAEVWRGAERERRLSLAQQAASVRLLAATLAAIAEDADLPGIAEDLGRITLAALAAEEGRNSALLADGLAAPEASA